VGSRTTDSSGDDDAVSVAVAGRRPAIKRTWDGRSSMPDR
jgi:hypothetical protein